MPADPTTLQFDGRLTNISIEYQNDQLVADLVLPPTKVVQKTGKFKTYDKASAFILPSSLVGPKGKANRVDYDVGEDTYTCADHAYAIEVPQEDIDNAEAPLQPLSDATRRVTGLLMLDREKRIADAVFNLSNYNTGYKLDVAGAWATLTTDIVTQLQDAIKKMGATKPTVLVMGLATWNKVQLNEKLLSAVKGTLAPQIIKSGGGLGASSAQVQELADFLGIERVIISNAEVATTKKGQTLAVAPVWDGPNATKGAAALLRVAPGRTHDVVWGTSFDWFARQVQRWNDPDMGAKGGEVIKVAESTVVKVIAKDAGYLFYDTLAT